MQITPSVLTEAMAKGGDVAKRALDATLAIQKMAVSSIEAAVAGQAFCEDPDFGVTRLKQAASAPRL